MLGKLTIQLGRIIPKLLPATGGTINAFVWKLGAQTPPMLLGTVVMTASSLIPIYTSLVSVQKESRSNFRSPLMKTLFKLHSFYARVASNCVIVFLAAM